LLSVEKRRAIYDQFGEEGLKGGVPDGSGGFTSGYTFHGDPYKVFSTFFGGNNPFAGKYKLMMSLVLRFTLFIHFSLLGRYLHFCIDFTDCPVFLNLQNSLMVMMHSSLVE